jgi:hypothetical protein
VISRPRCHCDECDGARQVVKQTFPTGRIRYQCAARNRRKSMRSWRRRVTLNRAAVAAEVLARGAGCEDCSAPFTRFGPFGFSWHHRSPKVKTADISDLVWSGRSVANLEVELRVCRLLCSRCHSERHVTGRLAA